MKPQEPASLSSLHTLYQYNQAFVVSYTKSTQRTDLTSFTNIGDDEINAIELDMRIRLAELQRMYKEKQKQLSKLHPKRDKSRDSEKESEKEKEKEKEKEYDYFKILLY